MEGPPFAERVVMLQNITPTIEKLIASGLWDDVLKLLYLSHTLDCHVSEREIKQKNKKQTEKASQKKTGFLNDRLIALEEYLRMVDIGWHSQTVVPDSEKQPLKTLRKEAIEKVFEQNKDKIKQILKLLDQKERSEDDFWQEFNSLFVQYLDICRENYGGKTLDGFPLKNRAKRSDESRIRSSEGAKKWWSKRKKS